MIFKAFIVVVGLASVSGVKDSKTEAIKSLLMEKAQTELMTQYNDTEYQIYTTPRWIPNSILELQPQEIQHVQLEGDIGRYANFEVTYSRFGRIEKQNIQVKVEASRLLPVLKSRMRNGDVLSEDSFQMRWIDIELHRDDYVSDMGMLSGKILRRTMNAGFPVKANEVSEALLVEAGEYVEMSFNNGGISISITCEARESGSKGEEIAVFCPESRKNYYTKIIAVGEAQWLKTY